MPLLRRMKRIAPYVVLLLGTAWLYTVANNIRFISIPDQIGPDVWPKIVLTLLMVACVFAMIRKLFLKEDAGTDGHHQILAPGEAVDGDDAPSLHGEDHPSIVLAVLVATVIYLLVLEKGGFFLCTLFYTSVLMWCGGVRRLWLIGCLSLGITLFFTYTFMKIVFVALPTGIEPFSQVSLGVMRLLGIH
ncbi:MAG TPA: tripartite tricarboxylate transporter TctB family protein [Methylovirgula sp.]|jgi:putative tricarboxylic transport membrane protein|nr:tripartite tricarboxylate transporter TctB family protein [Methylovirgula sp.]